MFSAARKRIIVTSVLVSHIFASLILAVRPNTGTSARSDSNVLVIASHSNYPPYEYLNTLSGEFKGFTVDILNLMAERMGKNVEFHEMSKVGGMEALREGNIDGVLGIAYSIERDAFVDFTSPICTISDVIFVREDTEDIDSVVDLEGRTVAVDRDGFIGDVLQRGKGVHIVPIESYEDALELLARGDVAAFVGSRLTGQYLIKETGLDGIKIAGSPIHEVGYCIAVQEGNNELISQFEKSLSAIKQSGEYERAFDSWFGKDIGKRSPFSGFFLWAAGALILILGFAGWMVNRGLKREVETSAKELAESNTRFQRKAEEYASIFEGANDAIFIIQPADGQFLEVNRKAEELTGYSREELLRMCMRDIHLPTDGARVDKRLAQVVEEASGRFDDAPILKKEGSVAHVDISASLIEYSGRTMIQCFLRDVSDRRLMQKQIVQTGKLASIGTFTAGLAHEIRNPLNSVNLQLLLLERRIQDGSRNSESESLHLINIVREEVSRLDNLVTEFLFFAKPLNLDCHPTNVHRILDDVFALFHVRMEQNGITLAREYMNNMPLLSLDEEKLKAAFINIVQNSIEAMSDGGELKVITEVVGKNVIISIEDTGPGIPEEDLDKVFEVFYTSKEKGTGLGLPISFHIIEMHGGTFEIKSKPEGGTSCSITMKIGPAKVEAAGKEHSFGA